MAEGPEHRHGLGWHFYVPPMSGGAAPCACAGLFSANAPSAIIPAIGKVDRVPLGICSSLKFYCDAPPAQLAAMSPRILFSEGKVRAVYSDSHVASN